MHIVQLIAENFKRLVAVEINPEGNVVTITGKNEAGKSSVLDSIWVALAGLSVSPPKPIREGQTKARIRLDLGEIIVERKFGPSGSTLTVQNADGATFNSPQQLLDSLLGELCFDPLAFARMSAREQFDELKKLVKLDVDIDELDRLNAEDYSVRTNLNREAKAKKAQASAIKATVGLELPKELIDESALLDALQTAADGNTKIEERKSAIARERQAIQTLQSQAVEGLERAQQLHKQADEEERISQKKSNEAETRQAELERTGEPPGFNDLSGLRKSVEEARETNTKIHERERRSQILGDAEELERESEEITERMDARTKAKLDAIAAAKMPTPGLGFGEGLVTFKGIPLEQVSDSEKLRVSLSIAMAANPKIRIIRIQDGSLLDETNLAAITKIAEEQNYQVWIERVDTSGKIGIVIEDGLVKASN